MKKTFALLLVFIFMLSVSAFAAPQRVATVSQTSKATGMKIGIGTETTPIINVWGNPVGGLNMATLRFIGESFSGSIGLLFQSISAGGASATAMGFGGKFTFNLSGGSIPTHAGAAVYYMSAPQMLFAGNPAMSGFQIAAVYGAETTVADHLNVGVDIYPLSFTSASVQNASTTIISVLSGTVHASYLF